MMPKSDFEKIILALVPMIFIPPGFHPALFQGTWIVLFYWLTVCFFKWSRILFPGRLLEAAVILWLAAGLYISRALWNLPPFWIISVYLFLPARGVTSAGWTSFLRKIVFQGGLFWTLSAGIGALKEIFVWKWQLPLFESPAGFFLILFLPVFFGQKAVGDK